jgi:hypothetical protein
VLERAVRVALARHHQVVILCPWPQGIDRPGTPIPEQAEKPGRSPVERLRHLRAEMQRQTTHRFHNAYQRLRRQFARLSVPVVCAAGDESVPLVLERLDRLRAAGRRR